MATPCPQEPIPLGWKVWRGDVPSELSQIAMDVRDHVRSYKRGTIVQTVQYQDKTVGVFVSSHTWTYKRQPDGSVQLLTGICIPGVSLLTAQSPDVIGLSAPDDLSTPDPTAAAWGADDVPVSPIGPLAGAFTGAAVGTFFGGPVGAVIGGIVGTAVGFFLGSR